MATLTLKKNKNGAPADRNPDRKPVRSAAGVRRPTLAKANEDRARREERFGGPARRHDGPPGREGGSGSGADRPPYGGERRHGGGNGGAERGHGAGRPGGHFGAGAGGGRDRDRGHGGGDAGGGYSRGAGGERREGWQGEHRGPRPESAHHHADRPPSDRHFDNRGEHRGGTRRDDERRPGAWGGGEREPHHGGGARGERGGSGSDPWRDGPPRHDRGGDFHRRPDERGGEHRPTWGGGRDERGPQPGPRGDRPHGGDRPRGDFRPQGDRPGSNYNRDRDRGGPGGFDRDRQHHSNGPRHGDDRFRDPRDERRPGPPRDFAPRGGPHGQAPGARFEGRDERRPPFRDGGGRDGGGFDPRRDQRGPYPGGGGPRGDYPPRQDGPRGDFRPQRRDDRGGQGGGSDVDGGPRPYDDRQRPYGGDRPRGAFRPDHRPDHRPAQRGEGAERGHGPRDEHRYAPSMRRDGPAHLHGGGEHASLDRGGADDHDDGGQPQAREARVWRGSEDSAPVSQAPKSVPARLAPEGSGERLSKRLGQLGLASRREADDWIDAGWVKVDGKVAHLGQRVGPDAKIEVDPIAKKQQAQRVTILIHKPVGYVSGQAEDGYEPASVLITAENRWSADPSGTKFHAGQLRGLAPAGRLDIDSTGLLVLTQDGRVARSLIANELADQPGMKAIEKEYLVRVAYDGDDRDPKARFPAESLALLEHGLTLDEVQLQPAKVSWQNEDQLRFVLREGRKRQIRRMCEAVGLVVMGLKRVRIGRITLGALPPGQWRYLAPWEHFD